VTPEERAEFDALVLLHLRRMTDDGELGALALITGYALEDLRDLGGIE
jgi:hypothetical protein